MTTEYLINPTGRFVIGGPQGDTGLTGRKIIVDTYGGRGRHGGGAFSGKDPSKVDRSAAYMGRWVAKNIVAAGLATRAEIQFAYAIGHPQPVSACASTRSAPTSGFPTSRSTEAVKQVFSFKPADIVKQLEFAAADLLARRPTTVTSARSMISDRSPGNGPIKAAALKKRPPRKLP